MTASNKPIKVLVVDDTVVYRKVVSDVLATIPGVEVVGSAHNGKAALLKVKTLCPDLLTLDIEMPQMNGLQVLEELHQSAPEVGAIMLSTLTHEGGTMTMRALELGAFDFIPKPQTGTMAENTLAVKRAMGPIIKSFIRSREFRKTIARHHKPRPKRINAKSTPSAVLKPMKGRRMGKSSIVAIGISTGGPNALAQMLPMLPGNLNVPVVIVQHMPPVFTKSLAKSLDSKCALAIREATNGEALMPNVVYIAPGGKQMKIVAGADGKQRVLKITDDPPENSCKPSVDYLFRSVADHYIGRATGVIMTGMGSDGTLGLKQMKQNGSVVIAQNEESCVVYGMPKTPIQSGIVDVVAPLGGIASEILKTLSH